MQIESKQKKAESARCADRTPQRGVPTSLRLCASAVKMK
jgi:hypothetical protein